MESWKFPVIVTAMVLLALLGTYIFWVTSEEYRIRKQKKKLGYPVKEWWYYPSLVFGVCLGPMLRKHWEHKHKYYRSDDYGPPDEKWQEIKDVPPEKKTWHMLPRGDNKLRHDMTNAVLAKVQVSITESLLDTAVDEAITVLLREMNADMAAKMRVDRIRARAEKIAQQSQQEEAARLAQEAQEREQAEHKMALELAEAEKAAKALHNDDEDDTEALPSNAVLHDRKHRQSLGIIAPLPTQGSKVSFASSTGSMAAVANAASALASASAASSSAATAAAIAAGSSKASLGVVQRFDHSNEMSLTGLKVLVAEEDMLSLKKEFRSVPLNLPRADVCPPGAEVFNRSNKALPNLHSRVRLAALPGEPCSDYINANYIRGADLSVEKYIVTQAPMDGSELQKKATLHAFWRMVYQHNSRVIVMLTDIGPMQCAKYWPLQEEANLVMGNLRITNIGVRSGEGFIRTHLIIEDASNLDAPSLEVSHFHFYAWKGEAAPEGCGPILGLVEAVSGANGTSPAPIVVHDDFGLGRSGVFIAIDHGMWQIKKHQSVDVLRSLSSLREDRGGLIETVDQYFFVYKCLNWFATRKTAAPPAYVRAPRGSLHGHGVKTDGPNDEAALAIALDREYSGDEISTLQIESKKATISAAPTSRTSLTLEQFDTRESSDDTGSHLAPARIPEQRSRAGTNTSIEFPPYSHSTHLGSTAGASKGSQGSTPSLSGALAPNQQPASRSRTPTTSSPGPLRAYQGSAQPAKSAEYVNVDLSKAPSPKSSPKPSPQPQRTDLARAPTPTNLVDLDRAPSPQPHHKSRHFNAALDSHQHHQHHQHSQVDLARAPSPSQFRVLDMFSSQEPIAPVDYDPSLLEPAPDPVNSVDLGEDY